MQSIIVQFGKLSIKAVIKIIPEYQSIFCIGAKSRYFKHEQQVTTTVTTKTTAFRIYPFYFGLSVSNLA